MAAVPPVLAGFSFGSYVQTRVAHEVTAERLVLVGPAVKRFPIEHVPADTIVIHGEQDFRIPYTQGLGVFTALQRRGIESRLLVFPNENHFVLKPADSLQWHHEVFEWLDAHLK